MKKIIISILSALSLVYNILPASAEFSEIQKSKHTYQIPERELTINEINEIDQYVIVKNNEYVLEVPESTTFSNDVLHATEMMISRANAYVLENSLVIDLFTKQITNAFSFPVTNRAYAAHQFDQFWWGVRHIFRTNAAAEAFASDLDTCSMSMSGVSTVYSLLFATGAGMAVSLGAGAIGTYCSMIASSVRSKKLQYAKIELDITWAFVYRVIEWHD